MTGPDIDTALNWWGRTVRDPAGEKIGSLGDISLDRRTDRPAWGGVRTGLFGHDESLVPLKSVATAEDGDLHVPFERTVVKDAPRVDPDVALDADEGAQLYAYYVQGYAAEDGTHDGAPDGSMVRSEDEVVVSDGPVRPAERVRLKVLVTDEVTRTVPVRREVVQLEHEPSPPGVVESVEDVDARGAAAPGAVGPLEDVDGLRPEGR